MGRHAVVAPLLALALVSVASSARAQSIIKNPGDHVNSVELEPHLLLRLFNTPHNDIGFGLGARATVPIVNNGFISTINNSVGISFGIDWMRYDACGNYYNAYYYDCGKVNHFSFPVVMQWNFFLTESWSVFGEPGLALNYYNQSCTYDTPFGRRDLCPSHSFVDPVFFAGARWHFSHYTALTMRIGWPYASVGVSFL